MLLWKRSLSLPGLGVVRRHFSLRRPEFRVYAVETQGLALDSARVAHMLRAFETMRTSRSVFQVVLKGTLLESSGTTHRLGPGQFSHQRLGTWAERWLGPAFRVFVVEWEHRLQPAGVALAAEGSAQVGTLSHADHQAVADATGRLLEGHWHGAAGAQAAARLVRQLSESGHPVPAVTAEALMKDVPPRGQELADAINHAMLRLEHSPTWVDVETHCGLSQRHIRRLLKEHAAWWEPFASSPGWRSTLQAQRLLSAALLASAPGISPGVLAHAVGYRSTRALSAALRSAAMPGPRVLIAEAATWHRAAPA